MIINYMKSLKKKNERNDHSIRTMLNLICTMKIFGYKSVESFRGKLSRKL